jgi:hypothetical protein
LSRPHGGRRGGHVEMNDLPAAMAEDHQHKQNPGLIFFNTCLKRSLAKCEGFLT